MRRTKSRFIPIVLGIVMLGTWYGAVWAQPPGIATGITAIVPTTIRGQGNFTASTSSTAINASLSRTVNANPFPTAALGGTITLEPQANASVGAYVCWQGGTCTAAIGEYLAPGQSRTVSLPGQNMTTQPPTVISTGTPVIVVLW